MIDLDEEIKSRLDRAIEEHKAVTVAYVDVDGKPHISFYGSTHVHSRNQLAIWVRNPQNDLIRTLPDRPHVAIIYGDIGGRVYYTFEGTASLTDDVDEQERVYQEMHPVERQFDPDKGGVAVIVDLDRVTILSAAAGKQVMER
ncbi:MAG: hypothetical protein GWM88_01055 [Pseudomonadales bacterium]|nr:pyridoxamine 5'-phosphate oxidase family protein [Pseudomonadales bacterium]NIX06678.1 hypothetical protein [Pseudomonadales bacterium]